MALTHDTDAQERLTLAPANDIDTTPANIEAEAALLGCILFDNSAYERVGDFVRSEHFYEPFHCRLFEAMEQHVRKGQLAEPIVLMERFKRDPAFEELGGLRYLADLVDRAPPASNAADYGRLIYDLSIRRDLIRLCGETAKSALLSQDPAREIIEETEGALYKLAETGVSSGGVKPFCDYLTGAIELAAEAYNRDGTVSGLATGLVDLDHKLGGLHPSDLLIIAGRPSMGKTALATNIAFHIASRYQWEPGPNGERVTTAGGQVLFDSLEMSGEQLSMRILAEVSGVSGDRIRRGQIDHAEFGRLRDAAQAIQSAPLYIDATGGLSIAQLCARARRQKRKTGLDLIVVDYLQLVTTSTRRGEGRVQEVTEITQGLKALAKELSVPVIALSQLSRKVEERDDKRPMLSDLRESGSIEQDADVVAFVYREAYYLERAEPKEGSDKHLAWQDHMSKAHGAAEVIIGKQRHGPIGSVRLAFNSDLTKFGNLAREGMFAGRDPYGSGS